MMQSIAPLSTDNRGIKSVTAIIAALTLCALTSLSVHAANKVEKDNVGIVTIGGLYVDFEFNRDFGGGVLRIAGPKGYALTREIPANAKGITADLLVDADRNASQGQQHNIAGAGEKSHNGDAIPNGQYVYEASLYTSEDTKQRVSGVFYVQNGKAQKHLPDAMGPIEEEGQSNQATGKTTFTKSLAEDDNITIDDVQTDGYTFLQLDEDDPNDGNAGFWAIANNSTVFQIHEGFPTSDGSEGTPRVSIPQGGNVGIGTTSPQNLLHVAGGASPQLRVSSVTADVTGFFIDKAELFVGPTGLFFQDDDDENIVQFHHSAASDSLVVTDNGTGFGTNSPDKQLHVQGNSPDRLGQNNTMLHVENTSGTQDARRMIELTNNGSPLLVYRDTARGTLWNMSPVGNRFVISQSGTGAQEFEMDNNGNLTIQGSLTQNSSRISKDRFAEIDTETVLAKLDQISIEEWSYKHTPDSRHVSPMAEDFHATFGLGPEDGIAPTDLAGIALAATKALKAENEALKAENEELSAKVGEMDEMKDRLERLENRIAEMAK